MTARTATGNTASERAKTTLWARWKFMESAETAAGGDTRNGSTVVTDAHKNGEFRAQFLINK